MKALRRKFCAILCVAMLVGVLTPAASATTFSDVSSHWAAGYIRTCADLGIVDGIGGGRFDPEGPVTNAAFTKMLCMAFYLSEEQVFENENRAAINTYFGGNTPWYGYRSYYFSTQGLLNGVDYTIQSAASANQPMNRNNMAQVAANVLTQKGISASEADMAAAQATMPDYYSVPEVNRTAVKMCYALGIIKGMDGGKFDGASTMTRAQACTVIIRLLDVVGKTLDPDPIVTPAPDVPTVKDIQVTTNTNASANNSGYGSTTGTSYTITDNGFGTGYLANGKEINEANITELLEKAKTIWPTDMRWTDSGATNNNWYANPGSAVTTALSRTTTGANKNISAQYACGGFATMISDYLFGKTGNPAHVVTNFSDIRAGDIIVLMQGTTARHVIIITGRHANGNVFYAQGNYGNVIQWSGTGVWDAFSEEQLNGYGSYAALSRWPQ